MALSRPLDTTPPSLLTTAACGGLRPAPDCRPRRALLHLSYSSAPSCSDGAFVTHAPNRTLPTPVSWAPERCQLGRCNREAGARKMHTNLTGRVIAAPDDDLMDARRDQFTDDRIASGIVWSDAHYLPRRPADGVLRVSGRFGD